MMRIISSGDNPILQIEVGERITEEDYEKLKPEIEKTIDQYGKVKFLCRMEEIPDLSLGAVVEDFKIFFKNLTDLDKVAVVGSDEKLKKLVKTDIVLPNVDMEYFDFEQIDEAWAWVKKE